MVICPFAPNGLAHGPKIYQMCLKLGPDFAERISLKLLDGFTPFKVSWSRYAVVQSHSNLPICLPWTCPWANNLSNQATLGSNFAEPISVKPLGRFMPLDTVLLIKFLPSLPVTAERGSAPSAPYPPERATSGIATCWVVGDTYRPVAKLSLALGWWTLPCLACRWARIRARPAKQSTGWRNTVTNV